MNEKDLHPQLLADCHVLGAIPSGLLLLHRNASIPWCILVPDTELQDLLELDKPLQGQLLADASRVAAFLKTETPATKINTAALGNVVPQLHLHVIGRHEGDNCWPQPVWGNVSEATSWDEAFIEKFRSALCAGIR